MDRRTYLTTLAVGTAGVAGCTGAPADEQTDVSGSDSDDSTAGGSDTGGSTETAASGGDYPADLSNYDTVDRDGTAVPLAPLADVIEWYRAGEVRIVDARGKTSYEKSHIEGAVLSPAPDGQSGDDPVADWDETTPTVCYCGCPHHLSSMRAETMIGNDFEFVAALDEGFWAWHDAGYPMAGSDVTAEPALRTVEGVTDPDLAGESAWARHAPTGQREAAPISDDGRFTLHLRFADVAPSSQITVETPGFRTTGSLSALTDGVLRTD
jgi:rhodanese-related sulfurtransferase